MISQFQMDQKRLNQQIELIRIDFNNILTRADKLCEVILRNVADFPGPESESGSETGYEDTGDELLAERDPIATDRQQQLLWYYEVFGVIGLAKMIRQVAEEEKTDEIEQKRKRPTREYEDPGYNQKKGPSDSEDELALSDHDAGQAHRADDVDTTRSDAADLHQTDSETDLGSIETPPSSDTCGSGPGSIGGHKSWSRIIQDHELDNQSRALFYLCSMSPSVIPALIRGDLPSKMQNRRFARENGESLKLQDGPGTYTSWIGKVVAGGQVDTQASQSASAQRGKDYSLRQLSKLVSMMRTYIRIEEPRRPHTISFARKVDRHRGNYGDKLDYTRERYYGGGGQKDDFLKHEYWLNLTDQTYLSWSKPMRNTAQDWILDIPMSRCYVYVGMSESVKSRAPSHWTGHPGLSPLFGLLIATTSMEFGDDYNVDQFTYQVVRVTRAEDIGLDEIMISILTSSYIWDGGVNFTYAGNKLQQQKKISTDFYQRSLKKNAESIQSSGLLTLNIMDAEEKIRLLQDALGWYTNGQKLQAVKEHQDQLEDKIQVCKEQFQYAEALSDYSALLEVMCEEFGEGNNLQEVDGT